MHKFCLCKSGSVVHSVWLGVAKDVSGWPSEYSEGLGGINQAVSESAVSHKGPVSAALRHSGQTIIATEIVYFAAGYLNNSCYCSFSVF